MRNLKKIIQRLCLCSLIIFNFSLVFTPSDVTFANKPHHQHQAVAHITASKVPLTHTALLTPTQTISSPRTSVHITLHSSQPPQVQPLSHNPEPTVYTFTPTETLYLSPVTITTPRSVHRTNTTAPTSSPEDDLVDNWELLFNDDLEGVFPKPECRVFDNNLDDGREYKWGDSSYRTQSGNWSAWAIRDGTDGLTPPATYPPDVASWLTCGPFDMSNSQEMLIRFGRWLDIAENEDFVGVYTSVDNRTYDPVRAWWGWSDWRTQEIYLGGLAGQPAVYIGWIFKSDGDDVVGEGAWLDNLEIWRYNTPTQTCGEGDPGDKGIVLDPYEDLGSLGIHPIIRAGDTQALDALVAADVDWVRLLFELRDGALEIQSYDRMVDSLCAKGISVLGLINQQTLSRQDYNDLSTAPAYRAEFAAQASDLAGIYKGRIHYWETWNEEDINPGKPPYIAPDLYANLLVETSAAIKATNDKAFVLFGGLSSAWDRSYGEYFVLVYQELQRLGTIGPNSPFDFLALHPYPDYRELHPDQGGLDPSVYLHHTSNAPNHNTILDQFFETMSDFNEGNKTCWITEIGWNSGKGGTLSCWEIMAVDRVQQAIYIQTSFDILFNEVTLWEQSTSAIDKIFVYQYRDIGLDDIELCGIVGENTLPQTMMVNQASPGFIPSNQTNVPKITIDWHFGLYESDKTTPKPAQCVFAAYPETGDCFETIYIPAMLKNY